MNAEHEKLIRDEEGPQGKGFAGTNRARYYYIVTPKPNGEATVEMYIVRNRTKGGRKLPEIEYFRAATYETDKTEMHFSNFDYCGLAGYRAYWEDTLICGGYHPMGDFRWSCDYKFGGGMLVRGVKYLNTFAGTKYEHGYTHAAEAHLHIMEYAELNRISPRVEYLVKGGFSWLLSPAFVKRLAGDEAFFRFFREHAKELLKERPLLSVVNRAYADGISIGRATKREEARKACRAIPAKLRKGEPVEKVAAYLEATGVAAGQYGYYLEMCQAQGRHLDEFGVRYPRDFHAAFNAADEARLHREEAAERAREAREARRRAKQEEEDNAAIAKLAEQLATAILKRDAFRAELPRTCEELRAEGNVMRNCIGGYGQRIADGVSVCVFIRDADGKPLADAEIRGGKVAQCYAKCNTAPTPEVRAYADTLAKRIAKIQRKAAKAA